MIKRVIQVCFWASVITTTACESEQFADPSADWKKVEVQQLSPDMQKVRDYVPANAVIAHRGSTFWVPEETEAAFRWARNVGADYIEADLQITKDGVILALHDYDLRRTSNIENIYPERENLPASSFTYEELMKLDAGSWFNYSKQEQARTGFSTQKQYISTLEDLIMFAQGKRLKRDANGKRLYTKTTVAGKASYTFEYEDDPADNGNRPGIYIETKEPWVNPGVEEATYKELDRLGWNVATKPATSTEHFITDSKGRTNRVNVGNTNGKVILQTFSQESLRNLFKVFKGKVPTCYLLWLGTGATDMPTDDPRTYAEFINFGIQNGAHFMGPSIAGAPNNYPNLLKPWQAGLIHKSGMKSHAYSFDSREQMAQYFGEYNSGVVIDGIALPYVDGMFTNRADITLDYFFEKKMRPVGKENSATEILNNLGY